MLFFWQSAVVIITTVFNTATYCMNSVGWNSVKLHGILVITYQH